MQRWFAWLIIVFVFISATQGHDAHDKTFMHAVENIFTMAAFAVSVWVVARRPDRE